MADVETVAPSAGAPTATPASAPSPRVDSTEDLLAFMQPPSTTVTDADSSDSPAEAPKTEAPAEPKTEPVEEKVAPAQPETKAADQPAVEEPPPTPEQAAETVRQLIKKSNLPADKKEELADLVYQAKGLKELGFNFAQARTLTEMKIAPEMVIERVKLHPTIEDAKHDAELARDMRSFANDYQTNPSLAARKLHETSPKAFEPFAQEIIRNANAIAPNLFIDQQSKGFKTALGRIAQEGTAGGDAELEAAANKLLDYVYGPNRNADAPTKLNPQDPIHAELDALKRRIASEDAQKAQGFRAAQEQFAVSLRDYGATAIRNEVKTWVEKARPTGMDADLVERASADTFERVTRDLVSNVNFLSDMERFSQGPPTQENLNAALSFAMERAKAYIPLHLKTALETWGKYSLAAQAQKTAVQQKAASKPDVGKAPGPASPSRELTALDETLAAMKSNKRLDPLEAMQLLYSRQSAG